MDTDIRDVVITCLQDENPPYNASKGIAFIVSKWLDIDLPQLAVVKGKGAFVFICQSKEDAQAISDNLGGDVSQNGFKQWCVNGNLVDLTS